VIVAALTQSGFCGQAFPVFATRWKPWDSQLEARSVRVLKADWTCDFIDEHCAARARKYKNQIDAASGAFAKLAVKRGFYVECGLKDLLPVWNSSILTRCPPSSSRPSGIAEHTNQRSLQAQQPLEPVPGVKARRAPAECSSVERRHVVQSQEHVDRQSS
jgi:hypothetical protein